MKSHSTTELLQMMSSTHTMAEVDTALNDLKRAVDVTATLLEKLFKGLIKPDINEDIKLFIRSEISSLIQLNMQDVIDYVKYLDLLLKATSTAETVDLKRIMIAVRQLQQNIVQSKHKRFANEIALQDTLYSVAQIREGISVQPELRSLKKALERSLAPNVIQFIQSEIVALTNQPMAASPEYRVILDSIMKLEDNQTLEFFKNKMTSIRIDNQSLVRKYNYTINECMRKLGINKPSATPNDEKKPERSPSPEKKR